MSKPAATEDQLPAKGPDNIVVRGAWPGRAPTDVTRQDELGAVAWFAIGAAATAFVFTIVVLMVLR